MTKTKKTGTRNVMKSCCGKVENFRLQVRQGSYYIYTTCHRRMYQGSVRFFKHEKYQNFCFRVVSSPVKSFDDKL